jgi:putative phosphoribosyl transferase
MNSNVITHEFQDQIQFSSQKKMLQGELQIPAGATGIALFVHGSGSSRFSPRNQFVSRHIRQNGIGTFLFDLLTEEEEVIDSQTRRLRFDIDLLTERLIDATTWIKRQDETARLNIGYFGASTGGGAALVGAALLGDSIGAVVSRGGRPDLAENALSYVKSPTLLIVGGLDDVVINLNEKAFAQLECKKELKVVPGATHLFEEPGTLEEVARLTAAWFRRYL